MTDNLATFTGYLTISDAMAVLRHEGSHIHRRTVLRWLSRNRVPNRKVGTVTIFPAHYLPSLVNQYGQRGRWD